MLKKLDLPILGLIENMSFFQPQGSDQKYFLFGKGGGKELAKDYKLELFSQIPLTEKSESSILYEIDEYKVIFDDLSSKVVAQMNLIKKKINQIIPQQKV